MTKLRLGAIELPPGEIGLLKTLLRLFEHDRPFPWALVNAPPYDALLIDDTVEPGPDIVRTATAVLRLTRMRDGDAPDTLPRPIRAERLQEWLQAVEAALYHTPSTAPRNPSVQPAPAATRRIEPIPAAADNTAAPRFKLRRWPPAIMLRGDARRIRMATLLSRRALTSTELAELSHQSEADCQGFLALLQGTGLVEPQHTAVPEQASQHTPAAHRRLASRVVAGIRRRLGL